MQPSTSSIMRDLDPSQPIDQTGLKRLLLVDANDRGGLKNKHQTLPKTSNKGLLDSVIAGARVRGWTPVLVGEYTGGSTEPARDQAAVTSPVSLLDELLSTASRPADEDDALPDMSVGTAVRPDGEAAEMRTSFTALPVTPVVQRTLAANIVSPALVQYQSLNDAAGCVAAHGPAYASALQPGDCEVWYARNLRDLSMGAEFCKKHGLLPKAGKLSVTHALVGKVDADGNMSRIYEAMQAEMWSPNGEARSLISGLGLSHTSMSVGDVIVVKGRDGRRTFMVDTNGFEELEPEAFADAKAAGSRGWSAEGAARAAADADYAASIGIALPPPVYALGSLLRGDGVQRAEELRREFEALPDALPALQDVKDTVDAEDRQDLGSRLADLKMTNALMIRVAGDNEGEHTDIRVERGALRKLTSTMKRELQMKDDMGVLGLGSMPEPELRQAASVVWNRCAGALKAREDAELPRDGKPPEQCRLVIRTRISERNGKPERQAFALVSEEYGEVDVNRIASACMKIRGVENYKAAIHYDRTNFSMDLMTHTNVAPSKQVAGESFRAGVRITSRDDGGAGLRVRAFVIRNLCLNVMIIHAGEGASQTIKHVGESYKLVKRLNDAVAAALKVVDKFRVQWDDASTKKLLDRVEPADRAEKKKLEALVEELAQAHRAQRAMEEERLGRELLSGVYRGLLVDNDIAGKRAADDLVSELLAAHWDPVNASAGRTVTAADSTIASVANGLTFWGQKRTPDQANDIEVLAGELIAGTATIPWRAAASAA